jgi:hypothetical protein
MAGQTVINSLGGRMAASTAFETNGEALEVAQAFRREWELQILPQLSNQYSFIGVTARGMIDAPVTGFAPATVFSGGNAGEALPTFVALKVKLQTETIGVAGRGRTGLPGLVEGATTSAEPNRVVAGTVTFFQGKLDAMLAGLAAGAPVVDWVVISRYQGTAANGDPLPRPGGPIASKVIAAQALSELGTRVSRIR